MRKPGTLALWTAAGFFGLFALAGAIVGPILLIASQRDNYGSLVWPMWWSFQALSNAFNIHEPGMGLLMLAGALGYGFIGFDLWLICWLVYRFYRWGFTWKPPTA